MDRLTDDDVDELVPDDDPAVVEGMARLDELRTGERDIPEHGR